MNTLFLLAIILLPFLTRMAGGGFGNPPIREKIKNKWLASLFGRTPEIFVGVLFGVASYQLFGIGWLAILTAVQVFAVQEFIGQGNTQSMNGIGDVNRVDGTDAIVQFFYKGDLHHPRYSWYCVGVKGLLLGLLLPPLGLLLTILHPAAYWLGNKLENGNHALAEFLWGYFALVLILFSPAPSALFADIVRLL